MTIWLIVPTNIRDKGTKGSRDKGGHNLAPGGQSTATIDGQCCPFAAPLGLVHGLGLASSGHTELHLIARWKTSGRRVQVQVMKEHLNAEDSRH